MELAGGSGIRREVQGAPARARPGAAAYPLAARPLPLALPVPLPGKAPLTTKPPRQRAKLWELNGSVHCSVIGTCLTTGELRRVMGKLAQADIGHVSDHDLHAEAVGLCSSANACSRLLHKALDKRHAAVLRQYAKLADEAAVLAAWEQATRSGDIPGAYWAVLTHPETGAPAIRRAFGDVHMLSHLVGAANRADIRRLTALEGENAALRGKLARAQARLQDSAAAAEASIRRLSALAAAAVPAQPAAPGEEAAALQELVGRLRTQLDAETSRRERADARLAEANAGARHWSERGRQAEAEAAALRAELAALEGEDAFPAAAAAAAATVLYVGGRPGAVARIRHALEAAGGALLAHDGGQHDSASLLPGLIGRADRVVFPVDCVSHEAALAVKRLCRQLGKPWQPLRSSGLGSFLVSLATPIPSEDMP